MSIAHFANVYTSNFNRVWQLWIAIGYRSEIVKHIKGSDPVADIIQSRIIQFGPMFGIGIQQAKRRSTGA